MMMMIMMMMIIDNYDNDDDDDDDDDSSGEPCDRVRGEAGPEPTRRDERGAEGVSGQHYKFELS